MTEGNGSVKVGVANALREYCVRTAKRWIGNHGGVLRSQQYHDVVARYVSHLTELVTHSGPGKGDIESIVFSKDRAIQVHGFLRSYLDCVSSPGRMYVLYRVSDGRHRSSCDELKTTVKDTTIQFVEESNFRTQLLEICMRSRSHAILLYVDDMIFTHPVDYASIRGIDTSQHVLSLSRGSDLTYSVVLQKPLRLPTFRGQVAGFDRFMWNDSTEFSDWTYPLGVSGYLYGRNELIAMLKALDFTAPNSLEGQLQWFKPFFMNRCGLCARHAPCICVHANRVQTECDNIHLDMFSVEELLRQWEAGNMIDISLYYGKPMTITQEQQYTFVGRTKN